MKTAKEFDKWIDLKLFDEKIFSSDAAPEKELWLALRSYSEVKKRFKKKAKISEFKGQWKHFRSYIRQAENYWNAAVQVNIRSSPLLFYYSFLNLVKAWLVTQSKEPLGKLFHGLSRGKDKEVIEIKDGIFKDYYNTVFALKHNNGLARLNLKKLLTYLTSIYTQIQESNIGESRVYPLRTVATLSKNDLGFRRGLVLALPNTWRNKASKFKRAFKEFFDTFEELEINSPNQPISVVFDMKGIEPSFNTFFQLKDKEMIQVGESGIILDVELRLLLKQTLNDQLSGNYRKDHFSAYLNLPYSVGKVDYHFNEELAIYTLMFYLSDLVRYRPFELDKMSENEISWLIDSFLTCCPIHYLKMITSRIIFDDGIIKI